MLSCSSVAWTRWLAGAHQSYLFTALRVVRLASAARVAGYVASAARVAVQRYTQPVSGCMLMRKHSSLYVPLRPPPCATVPSYTVPRCGGNSPFSPFARALDLEGCPHRQTKQVHATLLHRYQLPPTGPWPQVPVPCTTCTLRCLHLTLALTNSEHRHFHMILYAADRCAQSYGRGTLAEARAHGPWYT